MEEPKYDLYSNAFRASTFETYAAMRRHDPVSGSLGSTAIRPSGS
jgi:hypothetical protein